MTSTVFEVTGMHCASCAALIDESVQELDGVATSRTDLDLAETRVQYDEAMITADTIAEAIRGAGYTASLRTD